jgi:hypothetical protein
MLLHDLKFKKLKAGFEQEKSVSNDESQMELKPISTNSVKKYLHTHSLFIFKADCKIRQILLCLVTPTEDIMSYEKFDILIK